MHSHLGTCLAALLLLPTLHAAPPPELTLLQQAYDKALTTQVTTPHDTAVAELNKKFTAGLDRAIAEAQKAGKLPDIIAIEADKKRLTDSLPIPDDDDSTPAALKSLRGIYRQQLAKIDEARATAQLPLVTAMVSKLKDLETTLTKGGRLDEAKEVLAYREGLGSGTVPASTPQTTHGSSQAGRVIVWQMDGGALDEKAPLVKEMPGQKVKVRTLISPGNPRAWYLLAVLDSGKVTGWPANHGAVTTLPKDLKKAEQVVCGYTGGAALESAGKLKVWSSPEPVVSKLKFTSISMGSFHVLGIDEQGQVHGFALDKRAKDSAMIAPVVSPAISVYAGDNASMVEAKDGGLWVWTADKAEPKKVEIDQVRSAQWFYRNGIVIRSDGSCHNVNTEGASGRLTLIADPVPEDGGLTGDGEGHYAIWNAGHEWKFYGKDVNADFCSKQAAGCVQIVFRAGLVFGIKPE